MPPFHFVFARLHPIMRPSQTKCHIGVVVATVLFSVGYMSPYAPCADLRAELSQRAAYTKLSVARAGNDGMSIIDLTSLRQYTKPYHTPSLNIVSAAFAKSHATIVGVDLDYFRGHKRFATLVVLDTQGLVRQHIEVPAFAEALGVSTDASKIAFAGTIGGATSTLRGLHVLELRTGSFATLERWSGPQSEKLPWRSLSWSPDGTRLVYEYDGEVVVIEVRTMHRRVIAKGEGPDWSADGAWIAYRSPEGTLVMRDPKTGESVSLQRVVQGGIRWSPDSRYLLFWEKSQLVVLRLSDRATLTIHSIQRPLWIQGYDWIQLE